VANPIVQQGTLNRLRGSITWPAFSAYNITAPYLGREGIDLTFTGQATLYIDTMTGAVTSPEPYLGIDMVAHLLRTQVLANQFKALMESNSVMGDCTFRTDSVTLGVYQFSNTAIKSVAPLKVNGTDAGYAVTIGGFYYINSALFGG